MGESRRRPNIKLCVVPWGAANGGLTDGAFSGFSRCSSGPPEKGEKRQKKGEKGRFRPISGKGGQTPLKPPFVTPPFAVS